MNHIDDAEYKTEPDLPHEEIDRRGEEIYQHELRPKLEAAMRGKFVLINVESKEYLVGDNLLAMSDQMQGTKTRAPLYAVRIGYDYVGRIGAKPLSERD